MTRFPTKVLALGTALILMAQVVLPPAALAFDETLPGGTSPKVTSSPTGGQGPTNWWSALLDKVKSMLDPIDVALGDFVLTRQDVLLLGRVLPVDMTFTYRSRSGYNGPFGYGWDMSYNKRIKKLSNNNLMLLRGTNRKDEFAHSGSTTYTPPTGVYDTLVQNADGTYTLTSKHGDQEFYDANGNLTKLQDRNGNALTFTYDPAGLLPITGKSAYFVNQTTGVIAREYRLTQITDTIGRTISFAYTADGRVSTITYAGRTIRYTYDASGTGDLLSVTMPATTDFPSGTTTTYAYDATHNLTTITDAKNQTYLTNVYDAATDRVTSQTYGTGTSTIIYGTDTSNNPTAQVTDRRGFRTLFTFDAAGHITRQEEFTAGLHVGDPISYVTTYEYNAAGERTRVVLPRGNAAEFTYDAQGNVLEIRRKNIGIPKGQNDPSDVVTTFTYESSFNFIKTVTDPRTNTTTYTYDYDLSEPRKGNVRKITLPPVDGQTVEATFTYTSFGQLDTVTDPNSNVTKYVYDAATGYPIQVTRGFGSVDAATTAMTYDAVGNVASVTDANLKQTTFEYTAQNQLTKVTAPAPFSFVTYQTYDANGNLIQVDRQAKATSPGPRPALGTTTSLDDWQSTVLTYTSLDQLASVKDDLGNTTTFTYDANGNHTSIQDATLNTTTSEYDERNLLWKVTDAALPAGVTEYAYDPNGNLASLKDANTHSTAYTYDDFNRRTRLTYADGTHEDSAYDLSSNLTQRITPANQTITYVYDALNRLKTKTTPQETTTYTYDRGSRLASVVDADASLAYTYDALNRTKQVTTDPAGALAATMVSYTYDGVGNRTKLTYPDTSFITYQYDALNRVTTIKDAAAATIASFTYDALSRRTQLQLANGASTNYQYDAISRLVSLTSNLASLTSSYTYDPVGNRKTMTDAAGTHAYTYDKLSQLTAVDYPTGVAFADTSFTYDKLGNRTQVLAGATTSYTPNTLNQYTTVGSTTFAYDPNGNLTNDGTNSYTYDVENRLTQATTPTGTSTYTYDPLGRRLSKTVGSTTTRFLYDGDQLIAETDPSGTITAKYVYGAGIDEPLTMVRGSTTSYYHADGLGSVTALTDTTGAVVERYTYDVYGQPRITNASGTVLTQSAYGNRSLFTGREYDQETGLYCYRARYYDPRLGRFLQRDPVGYSTGLNLYSYVDNNPLNWTDPLGLNKNWHNVVEPLLNAFSRPGFNLGQASVTPSLRNLYGAVLDLVSLALLAESLAALGRGLIALGEAGFARIAGGLGDVARGARNAPIEFTNAGERFVRVGETPADLKFTFETPGGVKPGTYAFPEKTFNSTGLDPTKLKDLGDLPSSPQYYRIIEPPAGTPIQRGVVPGGQYGGSGGVPEVIFPEGV